MTMPEGPSRATSTTLRAPPKALVVGEASADAVRQVQSEGYFVQRVGDAGTGLE